MVIKVLVVVTIVMMTMLVLMHHLKILKNLKICLRKSDNGTYSFAIWMNIKIINIRVVGFEIVKTF